MPDPPVFDAPPKAQRRPKTLAPLRLRIIGTERHGQTIEIGASRCTVGAASNCTLRLRAVGVRPIHCLILRGLDGYVIRSLSKDTSLNGRTFREQTLRAGDRLRFGSVDLEVLGDGAVAKEENRESSDFNGILEPSPQDVPPWTGDSMRPSELLARIERLEEHLQSAASMSQEALATRPPQILEAASQTNIVPIDFLQKEENERRRLEAELSRLTSELHAAQRRLADNAGKCDDSRHAELEIQLVEERVRFESEFQKLSAECSGLEKQLAEAQHRFDQESQKWNDERSGLKTGFTAESNRREELEQELNRQQERFELLAAEVKNLGSGLGVEHTQFEQERRNWIEQRTALESTIAAEHHRSAELEQELKTLGEHYEQLLAARMKQLEASQIAEQELMELERKNWYEEEDALQASLAAERARSAQLEQEAKRHGDQCEMLVGRLQELEARLCAINTSASGPEPGHAATHPHESDGRTDSEGPRTILAGNPATAQRSEVAWLAKQFAATKSLQPDAPDTEARKPMTADAEYSDPVDDRGVAQFGPLAQQSPGDREAPLFSVHFLSNWQPPLEIASPAPTDSQINSSADSSTSDCGTTKSQAEADVFERLKLAGIWQNDGANAETSHPAELQSGSILPAANSNEPQVQGLIDVCQGEDQPTDTRPHAGEEDDSIEFYMQRLLNRVRGTDSGLSVGAIQTSPTEERTPVTEIEIPAVEPQPAAEDLKLVPEEYVPRSQAPELNANLAAMREIANDSRRRNILTHAQRTSDTASGGKLMSAIAGFAVALASVFFLDNYPRFAAAVLATSLTVACVCLWQSLSLRWRLFDSLKRDTDSLHYTKPDAPAKDE